MRGLKAGGSKKEEGNKLETTRMKKLAEDSPSKWLPSEKWAKHKNPSRVEDYCCALSEET